MACVQDVRGDDGSVDCELKYVPTRVERFSRPFVCDTRGRDAFIWKCKFSGGLPAAIVSGTVTGSAAFERRLAASQVR